VYKGLQFTSRLGTWNRDDDFGTYLKFSIDPLVKGPRGFIIKYLDTDEFKTASLTKYNKLWQDTTDKSGNMNLYSVHYKYGL